MKNLKGKQFLFTKTCIEREVPPENPEKPFKGYDRINMKPENKTSNAI